jgi:hypothetical protein
MGGFYGRHQYSEFTLILLTFVMYNQLHNYVKNTIPMEQGKTLVCAPLPSPILVRPETKPHERKFCFHTTKIKFTEFLLKSIQM